MDDSARPVGGVQRWPPGLIAIRLCLVAVGVLSLVGAFVGIRQMYSGQPDSVPRMIDMWHYALQLYVLETPPPLEEPGPYPLLLEITRFTAPLVTIYAVLEAVRVLISAEVRRRRTRRAHGHIIVCGDGILAHSVARRLCAAGERVVIVSSRPDNISGFALGQQRVVGDTRRTENLYDAGVANAVALYACHDDSAKNTAIAMTVGSWAPRRGGPAVYAHVSDPELCLALQARRLAVERSDALRVDFFNIDDVAARQICAGDLLHRLTGRRPRVLVVGATSFGRALVVEIGRVWLRQERTDRPQLTLVDDQAGRVVNELARRFPFLDRVCDLVGRDGDLASLRSGAEIDPPDQVFICFDDGQLALKVALTNEWLWRGGDRSLVVRQDQLPPARLAGDAGFAWTLFGEDSDALLLCGVVDAAGDPSVIRDDLGERLARVIHDGYLQARRRQLAEVPGNSPSLRPWPALPRELKNDNRAQAADIGRKLRMICCWLAPRSDLGMDHQLTRGEVEMLAQAEHDRWLREHSAAGWTWAEERDDLRRRHPALRSWQDLPDYLRERNRDAVRQLPEMLADYGFRIVRK